MKPARASPGLLSFMKHSPMRNPLNPCRRSSFTVAGLDMPLSLTFTPPSAAFGKCERVVDIGDERSQVPVVDTIHVGLELSIVEFLLGVHLEENLQAKLMGCGEQPPALVDRQFGGDKQYGRGPTMARLKELILIDDEVLI